MTRWQDHQILANTVLARAVAYEEAWSRYAHPDTSPNLTETQRIIDKAHAHQDLLDAVRAYRAEGDGQGP